MDNRINELTEAIVLGYLKMNNQNPRKILCVDLDGIAKEYFGFDVLYESIAEDDPDIVAFSANGIKPLRIKRNGSIEDVVFSEKTIVLDTYFKQPQNSIQRRLTLSHELGHKIYEKIAPGHDVGNYKKIFDAERDYTISEKIRLLRIELDTAKAKISQNEKINQEVERLTKWLTEHDVSFESYDDVVVRRMVELIRVNNDNTITVFSKFGSEIVENL